MTIRQSYVPGLFLAAVSFSTLLFEHPARAQEQNQDQTQQQAQPQTQQPAPPASQQQQPPASPPASATPKPAAQNADQNKDQKAGTTEEQSAVSKDRLFFALPNFLTIESAGKVPPLSTKQKFKVVAQGSFDKVEFGWYAVLSGIGQAENSEPGYGQGAQGYGKRYGAALADGT